MYKDFKSEWIDPYIDFISTYPPMSQKELNHFICQFDVGLAIEPGKDENNKIAVSNKIWTYLQGGLHILATNTPAQVGFLEEHEGHGVLFRIDETQRRKGAEEIKCQPIGSSLEDIITNIGNIRKEKKDRFERAKEFSWE